MAAVSRNPRPDAELNRARILAVARAAFAAEGLDVSVREIARRAGLGVATVHRHFPARDDLVGAVLAGQVAACEAELRAALADPDPWRALAGTVRTFGERQLRDRGLNQALLGPGPAAAAFAGQRRAHAAALAELVDRARAAGALRREVTVEDVRTGLLAIASLGTLPAEQAAVRIARLTELLLAGMRAGAVSGSSGAGPASAAAGG